MELRKTFMAYSKHGHISYILEANSKRPDNFSLRRRKTYEILQFKRQKCIAFKFKPKLKLNENESMLMLNESETIKRMKGSKNGYF